MRILCFGDSNTYGYDPRGFFGDRYDAEDRWPEILAKKTGMEVINMGLCGREIPKGQQLCTEYNAADLLLVMLGTNDLLQGLRAAEAAKRMEAFLVSLLPCCKRILLVAPPPIKRGAWVASDALAAESVMLAEEYRLLARKLNIPFADTRGWDTELCFDGVHFTEAGHREFAQRLIEACFTPPSGP